MMGNADNIKMKDFNQIESLLRHISSGVYILQNNLNDLIVSKRIYLSSTLYFQKDICCILETKVINNAFKLQE